MDFNNIDKYAAGGGYGHLGMSVGGSGGSGSDPFGGSFSGNIPGIIICRLIVRVCC